MIRYSNWLSSEKEKARRDLENTMALGLQNQYSRFSGGSTPIHNVLFPGGRPDLAQDLDMMLLLRRYSTGLSRSVHLAGARFTEGCRACNSPLYQHLSCPGGHELRPSFWACLNAHHGMHIRIYLQGCSSRSIFGQKSPVGLLDLWFLQRKTRLVPIGTINTYSLCLDR